MATLILNGSPNRKGRVASMLQEIAAGAAQESRVEWVNVYDLEMQPCLGCMRCRPDGRCVLSEDDAHRIGQKIKEADSLVIGTPTHWANMSAQLKVLLDRNVPVFMGKTPRGLPQGRHKGKQAVVVTACSTAWPLNILGGQSRGAIRAVREVLRGGGFKLKSCLVKPGPGRVSGSSGRRLSKKARAIGAGLNKKASRKLGPISRGEPDSL